MPSKSPACSTTNGNRSSEKPSQSAPSFQIKLPQSWLVTDGLGYQPQGIARLSTTVNLDQIFGIHFEWDSYERLVRMERSQNELEENYLFPAARQLAQEVDSRAADWAASIPQT
jgi:hypothetical protein